MKIKWEMKVGMNIFNSTHWFKWAFGGCCVSWVYRGLFNFILVSFAIFNLDILSTAKSSSQSPDGQASRGHFQMDSAAGSAVTTTKENLPVLNTRIICPGSTVVWHDIFLPNLVIEIQVFRVIHVSLHRASSNTCFWALPWEMLVLWFWVGAQESQVFLPLCDLWAPLLLSLWLSATAFSAEISSLVSIPALMKWVYLELG